ncbi:MAG: PEGA domain-containing protein [Gammaproteobacteria bacterium]|nr:PEGA domain-containing protein [Gammaproteobacteria bacterium]MYF38381.1 PEGA domain-containing protein [Gammaproteobacteria bacterium]
MTDRGVPNTLLQPDSFEPTRSRPPRRARIISWVQVIAALITLFVVFALWFIFTAKAVKLEPNVAGAEIEILDGLRFKTGARYLLRPGEYNIRGQVSGYYDVEQVIEVGRRSQQTIPITFKRLPGLVHVTATPVGASVWYNGEQLGQTPLSHEVPAGEATFLLTAPRYQDASETLDVKGMANEQSVHLDLAPNWGEITIPTQPVGASVIVDGQDTEFTTPGPAEILAGDHEISVKLPGYAPWKDLIRVEAGEQRTLNHVQLNPVQGALSIDSSPSSASVTINGEFKGTTPLRGVEVAPNEDLEVEVLLAGYHVEKQTVSLDPGQEFSLAVELNEETGEIEFITDPEDVDLFVNGKPYQLPADRKVTLHAVSHRFEISKEGYAGWAEEIAVRPGQAQVKRVRLLTIAEAEVEYLKQNRFTPDGQELVLLQPTAILMGASRSQPGRRANEPFRTTQLSRLFYIGKYEVSNADYRKFNPAHDSGDYHGHNLDRDQQPVVNVPWNEAALYCNYLSMKQDLEPFYIVQGATVVGIRRESLGYRLPSEAEWSWAARHISEQQDLLKFPWGSEYTPPDDRWGNFADIAAQHIHGRPIHGYNDNYTVSAEVGTFEPNQHGIHDLGGNVAEWVHDFYDIPEVNSVVENLGPRQGQYRVMRGSSYLHGDLTDLRLSFRDYGTDGRYDVGFRIARYAKKE